MKATRGVLASLLLALPVVYGCSKSPAPAPATTADVQPSTAAAVAAAPDRESAKACDLVTPAEMSTILGSTVAGNEPGHKSSGKTECIYQPTGRVSPYVEFSVEWGEGEDAMNAAGAMAQKEPGIDNPYAGIGDQAVAVGTSLMIRNGKDLVTITFSGVDHAPAKAKKIFDTAKTRM